MVNIGKLGEEIIAQWLQRQNYRIIAQRWRCREGEIDLISQEKKINNLVFVEVKTRNLRNWDHDGILAVNEQKQAKLWLTAETFLSQNPHLADLDCRFDLALLTYKPSKELSLDNSLNIPSSLNTPIFYQGYEFLIKDYLKGILMDY